MICKSICLFPTFNKSFLRLSSLETLQNWWFVQTLKVDMFIGSWQGQLEVMCIMTYLKGKVWKEVDRRSTTAKPPGEEVRVDGWCTKCVTLTLETKTCISSSTINQCLFLLNYECATAISHWGGLSENTRMNSFGHEDLFQLFLDLFPKDWCKWIKWCRSRCLWMRRLHKKVHTSRTDMLRGTFCSLSACDVLKDLNWLTAPLNTVISCGFSTLDRHQSETNIKLQTHVHFINDILNAHRHFDKSLGPTPGPFIC